MSAQASRTHLKTRQGTAGFLFVLPSLLLFTVFFVFPLVFTAWISLNNWPLLGTAKFVGLRNFARLLTDEGFWASALFTLKFSLIAVPMLFVLGLLLALFLKRTSKWSAVVRTCVFVPVSLGYATASYLWLSLLNPRTGILDWALTRTGVTSEPVNWFDSASKAIMVIAFISLWKFVGFPMIAFINGLNGIPQDLEEAASIDGAGRVRTFWSIKIPLLRPTMSFALTFLLVTAFLTFDQFYVLTAGGPNNTTMTMVYRIYNSAFIQGNLGTAAAMSLVFLVIVALINSIQSFFLKSDDSTF